MSVLIFCWGTGRGNMISSASNFWSGSHCDCTEDVFQSINKSMKLNPNSRAHIYVGDIQCSIHWKIPTVSPAITNPEISDWLGRLSPSSTEIFLQTRAAKCIRMTEWLLHISTIHKSAGGVITLIRRGYNRRVINIGTVQGYRTFYAGNCESRSGNSSSWLSQANSRLHQKSQRIVCFIILFP
jgi:hypothetical protein